MQPNKIQISLRPQSEDLVREISLKHNLTRLTAGVLAARGLAPGAELELFLNPNLEQQLPDLFKVKGLRDACELLKGRRGSKIAICCDYDVDGLTSGTLLLESLQSLGFHCQIFVPNRFTEGYGLSAALVQRVKESECDILITVDYGTTNVKEFAQVRELGLSSIIIDHHQISSEVPEVDAFINPNQEGCALHDQALCSAALTWCFLAGLHHTLSCSWNKYGALDLVSLATVCDMVPLKGLNRALAAHGIKALESSERPGLLALRNVSGVNKVSCTAVGFNLGPRINAAGRMADGGAVIDLFTTNDTIKARHLAEKLERLNLRRQKTEEEIKSIAVAEVEKSSTELPEALVIANPEFHTGVIGIVAQRLVEIYNRPAVVLGIDNGVFKGSVRGCLGFDVVDALRSCSSHLLKFGGHKAAGGCSLAPEKLDDFKLSFLTYAKKFFASSDFARLIEADTEAQLSEISLKSVNELQRLAPFGLGHPAPRILLKGLVLSDFDILKGKHLKLVLSSPKEGMSATALMWNTKSVPGISKGERVNIVARPEVNSFRGQVSLQLQLLAIEPSRA